MRKPFFILGLLICLESCNSSKETTGTYRSNFALMGLQMTTIKLKPDSTFEYVIKGKSIFDSSEGKYQILDHKLFLSAIWEKTGPYRWTRLERIPKMFRKGQDSIEYQSIFYFGYNKLYYGNFETGKKEKKAVGYHTRKKYILFGRHDYKKNYYLKKVAGPP